MQKDDLYKRADAGAGSFEFNDAVADVFPDMLRRSIPGYDASIAAIGALASRYVLPGTRCYDLGCSLGAATLAMRRNIGAPDCSIEAIDLSAAMVDRCRQLVARDRSPTPVIVRQEDIRETDISDAAMIVLNYTLQFLPPSDRNSLMQRIHDGMNPAGVLVLSEKVADEDPEMDKLLIDLHHGFKRDNAYSELEIARKRSALENVLVPETVGAHLARLKAAGFAHSGVWLRHFNFVSIVAVR